MKMIRYAVLEGHEVREVPDVLTWGRWFENFDNRVVAQEQVGDVKVSTVFLGLDHGFGGRPLWFESMVFGGELDDEQDRYATWDEAVAGHDALVERVKKDPQAHGSVKEETHERPLG